MEIEDLLNIGTFKAKRLKEAGYNSLEAIATTSTQEIEIIFGLPKGQFFIAAEIINAAIMALYDKSNLDVFAGSSTKEEIMANYQTTPRQLMAKRSIPDKTEIFKRDEFRCKKCGRIFPENLLICGHIIPLASGGSNHSTNLQTLCISCHKQKTKEDVKRIQEYREKLQKLKMFW